MKNLKFLLKLVIGITLIIGLAGCTEERKTFYDSGKLKTVGIYDGDDLRQENFKSYLEDGTLIADLEYKDGKIVSGFENKSETTTNGDITTTINIEKKYANTQETEYKKFIKEVSKKYGIVKDIEVDKNEKIVSGVVNDYKINKLKNDIEESVKTVTNYKNNKKVSSFKYKKGLSKKYGLVHEIKTDINDNIISGFESEYIDDAKVLIEADYSNRKYADYEYYVQLNNGRYRAKKLINITSLLPKKLYHLEYENSKVIKGYGLILSDVTLYDREQTWLGNKFTPVKNNILYGKSFIKVNNGVEIENKLSLFPIQYILNPTKEQQIESVKNNAYTIRYIDEPVEEVQLLAVKENGTAIRFIKNPSEKIQLIALKNSWMAIEYIKNPSEKQQLEAIKNSWMAIEYIKNPSEKAKLEAVKISGNAIRYIKNPSEEMQIAAVKKNGFLITYIKNPSKKVKKLAVKEINSKHSALGIKNVLKSWRLDLVRELKELGLK